MVSPIRAQDAVAVHGEVIQGYSLSLMSAQTTYAAGQSVPVVMTLLNVTRRP